METGAFVPFSIIFSNRCQKALLLCKGLWKQHSKNTATNLDNHIIDVNHIIDGLNTMPSTRFHFELCIGYRSYITIIKE